MLTKTNTCSALAERHNKEQGICFKGQVFNTLSLKPVLYLFPPVKPMTGG
jgi:hypothetical protein